MAAVSEPLRSRIVVGVDGSASSVSALWWALKQAQATGSAVEAVCVWEFPPDLGFGPIVYDGGDEDLAAAAERSLAEALEAAGGAPPDVVVERRVLRGHAPEVLLERAANADLLVVGSRGHGGFVGTLIGSVSLQAVQHAPCPVVVIRSGVGDVPGRGGSRG